MTTLYYLKDNSYQDIKYIATDDKINQNFYINLTNLCPCSCTFCLRQTKKMMEENSLWLKSDPSAEEVINELKSYDLTNVPEIIFCGFGEPLTKVDTLIMIASYLKDTYKNLKIRINTNGLCNLYHATDITNTLKGLVDTISISLNASNKEEYLTLTRSIYGIESFDAMLDFAKKCKRYVPNVVLTVVDILSPDELLKCEKIAQDINVNFRIRTFEK